MHLSLIHIYPPRLYGLESFLLSFQDTLSQSSYTSPSQGSTQFYTVDFIIRRMRQLFHRHHFRREHVLRDVFFELNIKPARWQRTPGFHEEDNFLLFAVKHRAGIGDPLHTQDVYKRQSLSCTPA